MPRNHCDKNALPALRAQFFFCMGCTVTLTVRAQEPPPAGAAGAAGPPGPPGPAGPAPQLKVLLQIKFPGLLLISFGFYLLVVAWLL